MEPKEAKRICRASVGQCADEIKSDRAGGSPVQLVLENCQWDVPPKADCPSYSAPFRRRVTRPGVTACAFSATFCPRRLAGVAALAGLAAAVAASSSSPLATCLVREGVGVTGLPGGRLRPPRPARAAWPGMGMNVTCTAQRSAGAHQQHQKPAGPGAAGQALALRCSSPATSHFRQAGAVVAQGPHDSPL